MNKICKKCGQSFEAKNNRIMYCNKDIECHCAVCNTIFEAKCNADVPQVCSRKCAARLIKVQTKVCEICGSDFHPNSSRQKYCRRVITKSCAICGDIFELRCGDAANTCSKACAQIYAQKQSTEAYQQIERVCEWCGELFHPVNNTQKYCTRIHYQTCEVCGTKFEIDLTKQDKRRTCSKKCADNLKFINGNPFTDPEFREKSKQTLLRRYGVDHPMHSAEVLAKVSATYKERTGYDHPSHNPAVRKKSIATARISGLESRVAALFNEYQIEFEQHYMITTPNASHEFDFYLPNYKFLIDCDGLYYHSYLDDPDGKHVLDYYDEDRLALIPSDHIFHVIVEGQEERDIKYIVDILKKLDANIFDYEGELFNWCRSIEFPYPEYPAERIHKDYQRLCNYDATVYAPSAKMSMSAIHQFHRSIFDAHVGKYPSPKEAWYDDKLLKKVIVNRLIYKNDVDPYKILQGFNISKICPRVSIFNPVLARHICQTYLSSYTEIFDPFSGYSGRLLGVCSLGKKYIGQDLHEVAISESKALAEFLHLSDYSLHCKDILNSRGEYEALLTCPPYANKEHYSTESIYKSCDDWIDEILDRFKCKRYAFVVDNTEKYAQYVVDTIKATSHFNTVTEQLIVI